MALSKHIHFEHIDSTNTWAKLHTNQWAPQGVTLVTASEQTAGRGRFKRKWISPPHVNIYATFCFWFDPLRTDVGHIPQILALVAVQVLRKQGFLAKIKWPNDVLLNKKKVGGILCETILTHEKRGIICGIGLNVNMPLDLLQHIDRPATSLWVEGGKLIEVYQLLDCLTHDFLTALNQFIAQGFSSFFSLLKKFSTLKKGDRVRFHDNQTLITAEFTCLHVDGSVELRLSDGTQKKIYAGEFLEN